MHQISDTVFAENFLFDVEIATPLLPSPYEAHPYLLVENFLDEDTCKSIIDAAREDGDVTEATLRSNNHSSNTKIRNTKIHKLSTTHQNIYNAALNKIRPTIEQFFSLSLTQSTQPQLLEYTKGSFYKAHSDDSSVLVKDGEIIGFKQVAPQRKITTLLFLSTQADEITTSYQFKGGELSFSYFKDAQGKVITFTPKMGSIIVFGSNPIYTHEVHEVTEGYRLTVAQWHDAIL